MSKSIDLTGQTFGKLLVISQSSLRSASGSIKWECQCSCGKVILVRTDSLKNGHTSSCGCFNREQSRAKNLVDLTGKTFARVTVLYLDTKTTKDGALYWICKCSCGNIKSLLGASLKNGLIRSCGCLSTETKSRLTKIRNEQHRLKYGLKEPTLVLKLRQKHKKYRSIILERDGNKCVLCGSQEELHIHHIVPLCHDTIDNKNNLVTLCKSCHEHKAHDFQNRTIINEEIQNKLKDYINNGRCLFTSGS